MLEEMRISEYDLRMEAMVLKNADEYEKLAQLAIYIRKAQDYNSKTGVYKVQKVSDLIDKAEVEKEIFEDSILSDEVFSRLSKIAKNLEEYHKNKEVNQDVRE